MPAQFGDEAAIAALQASITALGSPISPVTPDSVLMVDHAGTNWVQTVLHARGTNAARPAAGVSGRIYVTTDNPRAAWYDDGVEWVAIGAMTAVRTSDSADRQGNTTLTDDGVLVLPILANQIMIVQAWLLLSAATATEDAKWRFTGPAGSTRYYGQASGTGLSNAFQGVATTATPGVPIADGSGQAIGTAVGIAGIHVDGIIVNGATPGSVALQWAQNTNEASALVMKAGSIMIGHAQ